jgi:lipid II:glycine glycyltransferase (peptidoglycan interpeptide bridge formation enzyme)
VGHRLALTKDDKALADGFDANTRRNLRKAEAAGVRVEWSDGWEALHAFEAMNAVTRRRHGLPPQPGRFFRALHRNVIAAGHGATVLALRGDRVAAGAVFLWHDKLGVFKYAASAGRDVPDGSAHLVMREGFRQCRDAGVERLDFGRTDPANEGLRRYKRGFGGEEYDIPYYRYSYRERAFVTVPPRETGPHNAVFRVLPVCVLRWIGSVLYRHVA